MGAAWNVNCGMDKLTALRVTVWLEGSFAKLSVSEVVMVLQSAEIVPVPFRVPPAMFG